MRNSLIGQKFGSRTVLSFVGHRQGFGKALYWNCRCDCGSESVVSGSVLRNGYSQHCRSCSHSTAYRKGVLPAGVAAMRVVLRRTMGSAKFRKLSWALSEAQFVALTQAPCVYCGGLPSNYAKPSREVNASFPDQRSAFTYNGVDRADNTQGYTVENSVSCCWLCNRMKREMTVLDFAAHVKKIAQHLKEQEHGNCPFEK